jgi:hypothetical protein
METIQSLFTNATELEINQENEKCFSILADKFGNGVLRKVLSSFTQEKLRYYSLNFEIVSNLPLNIFQNFTLVLNNTHFRTNLTYLCCISNVIFNTFLQQPNLSTFQVEIIHEKEKKVLVCISNILNFISGSSFSFEGFSAEIFFIIVDKLEIIGFEDIILQLYPIPTKFDEAENFLQFKFAPILQVHFQQSIEMVSS